MSPQLERARLAKALESIPSVALGYQDTVQNLIDSFHKEESKLAVSELGSELWEAAVLDVQSGNLDDRPLYWSRLAIEDACESQDSALLNTFELFSRNFVRIPSGSEKRNLVLTSFDPFLLDLRIDQSNPSAVFALLLHGTEIAGCRIHSMVFPVRYQDFDDGCVEKVLSQFLVDQRVKGLVTVSMGREGYDLERFPAQCRGAIQPDNAGRVGVAGEDMGNLSSEAPGFVEFSLPIKGGTSLPSTLQGVEIRDNRTVTTEEDGEVEVEQLQDVQSSTPIQGSGGNFLSNEISYRSLVLRSQVKSTIPAGHIHVPRMNGHDPELLKHQAQIFKHILSKLVHRMAE